MNPLLIRLEKIYELKTSTRSITFCPVIVKLDIPGTQHMMHSKYSYCNLKQATDLAHSKKIQNCKASHVVCRNIGRAAVKMDYHLMNKQVYQQLAIA